MSYIRVPAAKNGPTVGLQYGQKQASPQFKAHTVSNRSFEGEYHPYSQGGGPVVAALGNAADSAVRGVFAARGFNQLEKDIAARDATTDEGGGSSLGSPRDHANLSSNNQSFMNREIGKHEWFDNIDAKARPQEAGLPTRTGMQPELPSSPDKRPAVFHGQVATVGGSSRSEPIEATHRVIEPRGIGAAPQTPTEAVQTPQSRLQKRSGKQSESLSGIDWSQY